MASKFECICGEIIRTNLYEGNNVKLLVPEEYTDIDENNTKMNLTEFIDRIVIEARCFIECNKCGRIAVVNNDHKINIYEPLKRDSE